MKDALKYLKYGEDDAFKAAMINSIATFYRVRFLRDLTENGYKEYKDDIQRAFENFRIPDSVRQCLEVRPHKDKSDSLSES